MRNFTKTILATLMLVAFAMPALAQTDLIELMRSDLRTEKMSIVTKAMQLTEEQSQLFWPVYKEYEGELIKLNDERVLLIKDYGTNYDSMTDDVAKDLIGRSFKLQEGRTKLLKSYTSKMDKAVDTKTAARWAQVEYTLNAAIDLQVGADLPLMK